MGIEDLAIALASQGGAQKAIAEDNPYLQFQAVPDTIGNVALQAAGSGKYGLGETALVSGLAGLLSGGLGAAGNAYQRNTTDSYAKALTDALTGNKGSDYGLSGSVFSDAQNQASLFKLKQLERQQQIQDTITTDSLKTNNEIRKSLFNTATTAPRVADRKQALQLLSAMENGVAMPLPTTAESATALSDNAAQPSLGEPKSIAIKPGSKERLAQLENELGDYDLAKQTFLKEVDQNNPEQKIKSIQQSFVQNKDVQDYAQAQKVALAFSKALKDKGAMVDNELVRYAILMIEPGLAVREGEANAIAKSQSIPDALKGEIKAALGGSKLSDSARAQLKALGLRALQSHKFNYDKALGAAQNEATLAGVDPSRVSYLGESVDPYELFGNTKTIGGNTYYQVEGGWRLKK